MRLALCGIAVLTVVFIGCGEKKPTPAPTPAPPPATAPAN